MPKKGNKKNSLKSSQETVKNGKDRKDVEISLDDYEDAGGGTENQQLNIPEINLDLQKKENKGKSINSVITDELGLIFSRSDGDDKLAILNREIGKTIEQTLNQVFKDLDINLERESEDENKEQRSSHNTNATIHTDMNADMSKKNGFESRTGTAGDTNSSFAEMLSDFLKKNEIKSDKKARFAMYEEMLRKEKEKETGVDESISDLYSLDNYIRYTGHRFPSKTLKINNFPLLNNPNFVGLEERASNSQSESDSESYENSFSFLGSNPGIKKDQEDESYFNRKVDKKLKTEKGWLNKLLIERDPNLENFQVQFYETNIPSIALLCIKSKNHFHREFIVY